MAGCAGNKEFVAVPVKLADIPINVKECLAGHVKLPQGDWTAEQVSQVVALYQAREGKLEDCIYDVVAWYKGYQKRMLSKKG